MPVTENYAFQVGTIKCIAMSDSMTSMPGQRIVRDVPDGEVNAVLAEHGLSPVETEFHYNCLYVQTDQHRILIDAGVGRTGPKTSATLDRLEAEGKLPMPRSAFPQLEGALLDRLADAGVAPAEIDKVIITHCDGDHIGGLTFDGERVFTRANYVFLKDAWDFWSNETRVAQYPEFLMAFGRRTLPLIEDRLQIVEAGVEFLQGFRLLAVPGHRPGHTAVTITSEGAHLLHVADTIGHPLLMKYPHWHGYADLDHEQAAQDRLRLLSMAAEQQALVFGSHLPFPGVGHVMPHDGTWRWEPVDAGKGGEGA
jgi:glyoxylase-like metal-dependent hydrolase (beta-lactamase superfamily II)